MDTGLEYHIVALLMIPGFMWAAGALMALVNWTIDGMTFHGCSSQPSSCSYPCCCTATQEGGSRI
ncbi:MAG: hypothetical protein R3E58_15870 [Phycisphaerae bacterium]